MSAAGVSAIGPRRSFPVGERARSVARRTFRALAVVVSGGAFVVATLPPEVFTLRVAFESPETAAASQPAMDGPVALRTGAHGGELVLATRIGTLRMTFGGGATARCAA